MFVGCGSFSEYYLHNCQLNLTFSPRGAGNFVVHFSVRFCFAFILKGNLTLWLRSVFKGPFLNSMKGKQTWFPSAPIFVIMLFYFFHLMCFKCKTCPFDIFCNVSTISHKHRYVLKILKSIKERCETFRRSTEIYSEQGHFIALLCNLFWNYCSLYFC